MMNKDICPSFSSPVVTPLKKDHIVTVTSISVLKEVVCKLSSCHQIAIDTESNGFYAYFEKICLIQISNGQTNYIIDPLTVKDCSILGKLFENPQIEKVMHDARNDIIGLKRDFGMSIVNLFDTSVACRFLGKKKRGLRSLLKEYFNISISKKGQHYNWGKRPLDDSYIYYAALDVHYLLPLALVLKQELNSQNLLDEAKRSSEAITELEASHRTFPRDGYVKLKGFFNLSDEEKEIVKRLYGWRDSIARKWDRAPFRVLPNETIIRLAKTKPVSACELQNTKGVPKAFKKGQLMVSLLNLINSNSNGGEKHP